MPRRTTTTEGPDPIDAHVGRRMEERRLALNLSLADLAQRLGVSWQQVRKRERGTNRMSAAAIYYTAAALDVPVTWLFDGIVETHAYPLDTHSNLM